MSTAAPDTIPALFDGFLKSVTSSPVDVAGGAAKVLPGAVPPPPQIMVARGGAASTTGTCVTTKKTLTFVQRHWILIVAFVLILVVAIFLFVRAQIKKKAKQREESEKKEDEYASFFKPTDKNSPPASPKPAAPGLVMPPANLLQPPPPFGQKPAQQQQQPAQQFQQQQQAPQQFQQQPAQQQPIVRAQAPVQPPAQKFDAVIALDSVPTSAGGSPAPAAINGVEQSGKRGRLEKESTIPASDVGSAPPASKETPPPQPKAAGGDPNFSAL